jgi:hypothetical protein
MTFRRGPAAPIVEASEIFMRDDSLGPRLSSDLTVGPRR